MTASGAEPGAPAWGCDRLSETLRFQGTSVSGPTAEGTLNRHGMVTRYERLVKMEEKAAKETIKLATE